MRSYYLDRDALERVKEALPGLEIDPELQRELTVGPYADIINRERPVHINDRFAREHPPMDRRRRAKIFAPFAALKGFDAALAAVQVDYEPRRILDAEEEWRLNRQLNELRALTRNGRAARENAVVASVEYFAICRDIDREDAYQRLGTYETATGTVRRVDPVGRTIKIGEKEIEFKDIYRIRY